MPQALVEGRAIAYEEWGSLTGLPVVLVHGFPLRGAMWAAEARVLGSILGYRVIVPDLRGYGASDPAPAGPITMDDGARDVLGVMDHLGIERFVLGGLSMGGYISFALLRRAQARVAGLILADTRATSDSPEGQRQREALAQGVEQQGPVVAIDGMVPRFFAPSTHTARPELIERARSMIMSISPTTIASAARGLALRPDSTPQLGAIICPTIILCGADDALTPPADAEAMRAWCCSPARAIWRTGRTPQLSLPSSPVSSKGCAEPKWTGPESVHRSNKNW